MQVYASIDDIRMPLAGVPAHAQRAEALGFDGLIIPEAVYDATLASALALEHTTRLRVATGVVVAFARSPMLLAQDAWALQQLSDGRFELGVGPQVKGNVQKRFGMPWSAPAARMRDYVGALRAVFDCWQNGTPLQYESESYSLTRMQPFFQPEPLEHAGASDPPGCPIWMGAIGPRMTRVAGELANAVVAHPTNSSPDYLAKAMRPALEEGSRGSNRAPEAVQIIANPMTATGPNAAAVAAEREAAREILTFTYSTPAYWATLEHHGWGDVGRALLEKTRAGDWDGMKGLVTDEMLDVLVPSGAFSEIASVVRERYAGIVHGISLRMPADPAEDRVFARVVEDLRAA